MPAWREISISELAAGNSSGVAGGPFGSSLGRKHYVPAGVPVIRGAQLAGSGRFSLDDLVFVSEEKADRHAGNLAHPKDVIVTQRGTLGQVGLIPADSPHDRYLLSQSQMKITVDPTIADPEFLYLALSAPDAKQRLVDHAMTAGVPHINLATLRAFQVCIPDIRTQRRIAAVLSAFDELIEMNERRIDLLEDLGRSLYREWFVHLHFPGHEDLVSVEAELGNIPEGWQVRALGEIAAVNDWTLRPGDLPDPLRYLDISAVGVGRIGSPAVIDAADAPGRARRKVRDGDVVWATVRPNRRAHALVHDPPQDLVASTGLAVLTPVDVPSSFLFEYASDPEFTNYLASQATGAAYPAVRPADFAGAPVLVPPVGLLRKFDGVVDRWLRFASSLRAHNHQLATVRDLLLPRLVTGRLDISDIDLGVLTPADVE